MKHSLFIFPILFLFINIFCSSSTKTLTKLTFNYRSEMRILVQEIASYARSKKPRFIIIPQNGHELITKTGTISGNIENNYMGVIDAIAREDLYYGYEKSNYPTLKSVTDSINEFLNLAKNYGKQILVIDYCNSVAYIDNSFNKNYENNYISFVAPNRLLNKIPSYPKKIFNENRKDITSVSGVKNFLYLINPQKYATLLSLKRAIARTNYDLIIIDAFFKKKLVTVDKFLRFKQNGKKRLVIAYMSIGEAEIYRYYWNKTWKKNKPPWIFDENPEWPGNFKVAYWHPLWKSIIYKSPDSYVKKIITSGFDGVYLDIIDAYEYFESSHKKLKK